MIALQEIVGRFEAIKLEQEIAPLLSEIAGELRAANMTYAAEISAPAPHDSPIRFITTYSKEWESRYLQKGYLHVDPVPLGIDSPLPFDWQTAAGADAARWLFREAESFGVDRQGVVVPIRGKAGRRALVTLTSFHSDREWQTARWRYQTLMAALAPYLHELSLALHRPQPDHICLSDRQRQCLELFGRGEAPKQIAARLGISGSMTRQHLSLARRKLARIMHEGRRAWGQAADLM
jgi:DNA-binding CsgD family transcriptional regulator